MQIQSGNTIAMLPYVAIKDLVVGQYYVMDMVMYDDNSGDEVLKTDIVFVLEEKVPGQGSKPSKQVRFCGNNATKRFSQLPGAQFYGPFKIVAPTERYSPSRIASSEGLESLFRGLSKNAD